MILQLGHRCDYIYISGFGVICDILGYLRFSWVKVYKNHINVPDFDIIENY